MIRAFRSSMESMGGFWCLVLGRWASMNLFNTAISSKQAILRPWRFSMAVTKLHASSSQFWYLCLAKQLRVEKVLRTIRRDVASHS